MADAPVLGGDVQNVVSALRGNSQAREIEGLGVHFAVHGDDEKLAETGRVHGVGGQGGFAQILSGPGNIVVIGKDIFGWS